MLSPEEYEKVQAENRENQIQAKKEGADDTAGGEEEERPPGEDEPANDSVINFKCNESV